jgi:hypothetical protein
MVCSAIFLDTLVDSWLQWCRGCPTRLLAPAIRILCHRIQVVQRLGQGTNASEKVPIAESVSLYESGICVSIKATNIALKLTVLRWLSIDGSDGALPVSHDAEVESTACSCVPAPGAIRSSETCSVELSSDISLALNEAKSKWEWCRKSDASPQVLCRSGLK